MNETISACPACGSSDAAIVHEGVPDFVFRATDELWTIVSCADCASCYLHARPDAQSIGHYYRNYYTHEGPNAGPAISGIRLNGSVLRLVANSWRNHHYGTRRNSLGNLGVAIVLLMPPVRAWIDAECRHLPSKKARPAGFRVLDVGCGDGRFVQFAQEAGCNSVGMEVDPTAVARNRARGLNIHEGDAARALQLFGSASFDWITLSHVIEHVHDPAYNLAVLHDLLRPDGHLWLETPNPSSFGHRLFGSRWRDLDPPRHLCLMSRRALKSAAGSARLALVAEHRRPFVSFETFPFSAAALARDGGAPVNAWRLRLKCLAYDTRSLWDAEGQEWLTMVFGRSDR